jgi:DNA-binding transcriptional regulator YhcF (GntR family)
LADQAADALFARIRSGEWALGAKLPGETTPAPQLGVGRSTVREAIRQLAGRGIPDSRQGSGVFVTALDAPDDWEEVLRRADIVTVIEAHRDRGRGQTNPRPRHRGRPRDQRARPLPGGADLNTRRGKESCHPLPSSLRMWANEVTATATGVICRRARR